MPKRPDEPSSRQTAAAQPARTVPAEVPGDRAEPVAAHIPGLPASDVCTPADRYAELFVAVQMSRVFADGKTFVDCAPKQEPAAILERYRRTRDDPGFDLAAFVHAHFEPPPTHDSRYVADPQQNIVDHIDALWDVLTRKPEQQPSRSSLLPLPAPYVVPGGRFGEIYYWDSYFTMLGLAASGRHDLLRSMASNFAYLIDTYGHVPNGNRTYYLSRSQPPVFALMVELFEEEDLQYAIHYLPQLRREHRFWMTGAESLAPGQACRHVVRLPGGELLNRYWDDRDTPRDESYREDVEAARDASRPAKEVYRDLRAGAASGWDYSSRWLGDPSRLGSIRTTSILPIDLNAFLYKLEISIARLSRSAGDVRTADDFDERAARRRAAVDRLLWDAGSGTYRDYDWRLARRRELTAAGLTPLFVRMADDRQAAAVAKAAAEHLLVAGGIATTTVASGQQWDRPNGWAPLQWIAIHGLRLYGENELADTIASRWLDVVGDLYKRDCKLVEKYDISAAGRSCGGDGGEYPLQDGFGWTNGVTRRMLSLYECHRTREAFAERSA
ncbi:MAG: alpha,alpha-trehalase TreF [Burkholderiaceae bacterium]